MFPSSALRAKAPGLPEVSEVDVVRHFVNLSQLNHSVDNGFYPLGSCTMKYNPKVNEDAARLPGFARIHPDQPADTVQGALEIMSSWRVLCEIAGMSRFTLQPAAGAHGELTGLLLIKAYHDSRADFGRKVVLVPRLGTWHQPCLSRRRRDDHPRGEVGQPRQRGHRGSEGQDRA